MFSDLKHLNFDIVSGFEILYSSSKILWIKNQLKTRILYKVISHP